MVRKFCRREQLRVVVEVVVEEGWDDIDGLVMAVFGRCVTVRLWR